MSLFKRAKIGIPVDTPGLDRAFGGGPPPPAPLPEVPRVPDDHWVNQYLQSPYSSSASLQTATLDWTTIDPTIKIEPGDLVYIDGRAIGYCTRLSIDYPDPFNVARRATIEVGPDQMEAASQMVYEGKIKGDLSVRYAQSLIRVADPF